MMIALFDVDIAFCVIMIEPKEHVWDRTKEKQQQKQQQRRRQLLFGFFRRVFLDVKHGTNRVSARILLSFVKHLASTCKSRISEFCETIQSFLMNFCAPSHNNCIFFRYSVACYIFHLITPWQHMPYWYWNVPHVIIPTRLLIIPTK